MAVEAGRLRCWRQAMLGIFNSRGKDAYQKGFGQGYKLGFQMGQLEAANKIWALAMAIHMDTEALRRVKELLDRGPKTLAEKQIELILKKAQEGKL